MALKSKKKYREVDWQAAFQLPCLYDGNRSMKYRIIFKNFKSNLKNYLVFFVGNIIGVTEMLIFWGMYYSIVEMLTQSM